jgi:hypothetical protein
MWKIPKLIWDWKDLILILENLKLKIIDVIRIKDHYKIMPKQQRFQRQIQESYVVTEETVDH